MDWLTRFIEMLRTQHELIPGNKNTDYVAIADSLQEALDRGDYKAIQGILAGLHPGVFSLTPEMETWLNNMIASQNTAEERSYIDQQNQTNILNAADQLKQLGLSASGVLQTGGNSIISPGAADSSMANLAQQRKMQQYQAKMGIAKSILGMVGSMASAGIYGTAIGSARKAASVVTSAAAHSAYGALSSGTYKPGPYEKAISDGTMSYDDVWKMLE